MWYWLGYFLNIFRDIFTLFAANVSSSIAIAWVQPVINAILQALGLPV